MNKIPKATARRLVLYYRSLKHFKALGYSRISSEELGEALQIDSATIRRDFSYFGTLGKRGYGYDVLDLVEFFKMVLSQDQLTEVAIVGVGHLGQALISYNFKRSNQIHISVAFDSDPKKIGSQMHDVPIYSPEQIVQELTQRKITTVILTVPKEAAQDITDRLADANVKGILNFTTAHLNVPVWMNVQTVDLANELQTLIYYVNHH